MLPLDDKRWSELRHAYGAAQDTPALLRALAKSRSDSDSDAEPYFSLWSSLCHQGDVYTASYAAMPHIVDAIARSTTTARFTALQLATCIEIGRRCKRSPPIPKDLEEAYRQALSRIPKIVEQLARRESQDVDAHVLCAALAVATGNPELADAILELTPDVLPDLKAWIKSR